MVCTSHEPMPMFSALTTHWGALKKKQTENTGYLDLNVRDSNLIGPSHGFRSQF